MRVPPPFSEVNRGVGGVSSVFKEGNFGSHREGDVCSKTLTFPVDNLLAERKFESLCPDPFNSLIINCLG